jgi:hypothetical protein
VLRVLLLVFLVVNASAFATEPEVVDWRDAAQCVGRVCGIRGTVVETEHDGPSIRLYFDRERRDVRVLLMRGWLVTWPPYDGQTIIATGKVDRFRDHVEMILLDPRNVTIVGGEPAATPSVAASATPSVAPPDTPTAAPPATPSVAPPPPSPAPTAPPSEAEELRQRVRELEQRVRELEER